MTPPDRNDRSVSRVSSLYGPTGPWQSMPHAIEPMLATDTAEPFDSAEHIFELMCGGMRTMVHVHDGVARLRARNGLDLTPFFPELQKIPDRTQAREAILDGEIVVVDGDGQPAFDLLRSRLNTMSQTAGSTAGSPPDLPLEFRLKKVAGQISFQAYDIVWLDGHPLLERPLWQRKNRLHEILLSGPEFAAVDFVDDEGIAFYDAVISRRLEGVVAKQKASVYTPGRRSGSWLQVRSLFSGDFVIAGYAFGGTRRKGDAFSQLLLGGYTDGRLEYVGSVSGGMDDTEARDLVAMLESAVVDEPAFHDPPPIHRLIYWTQPKLVCRVRYSEWSPEGYLRFPIFSALRPDLAPEHCTLD